MELGWDLRHRQGAGTNKPHPARPGTQSSGVGVPILFASGQFAGRKIRFELQELQKAESGRKKVQLLFFLCSVSDILLRRYAKVDRRPLDPPPAVLLRMFELRSDESGQWERELSYE